MQRRVAGQKIGRNMNSMKNDRRLIRRDKLKCGRKLASNIKMDSKSFYRQLNKKIINRVSIGPLESVSGELIMETRTMAGILH